MGSEGCQEGQTSLPHPLQPGTTMDKDKGRREKDEEGRETDEEAKTT